MTTLDERLAKLSPEKRALFEKRLQKIPTKKKRKDIIPLRENKEGPWQASLDQTALWFFHKLDPNTTLYNLGTGRIIKGALNISVLEQALNEMVRRHEILRTTFTEIDNTPYQVVHNDFKLKVPVIDLRHVPHAKRQAAAVKEMGRQITLPFNLETGPLVRLPIIQLEDKRFILVMSLHHAVTDWWSYQLFYRELFLVYASYLKGRPSPLQDPPIQFIDFSEWRNNWLKTEDFRKQLDYWKGRLEGVPTIIDFPTDRPHPPVQTYGGSREFFVLPIKVLEKIRDMNRRHNATSLMTTLAGTFAFLSRYTGMKKFIIGTSSANREREEIENMMGYLLNILMLTCDLTDDPTFDELVKQTKETMLGTFENKDLPFRYLVEEVNPERNLSRMPLYQVDFNHVAMDGPVFQDHQGLNDIGIPGYEFEEVKIDRHVSDVDLQVDFAEAMNDLTLVLEYNTDVFDAETIRRMGGLFIYMLEVMLDDPSVPISKVAWLQEHERKKILSTWNNADKPYPHDVPVHQAVAARAEKDGDAVAVQFEGQSISYADLNASANRYADYLIEQGVTNGAMVGVCLRQGPDLIAALLGILKAGGAYVPLDQEYPSERLSFMLQDTGMTVLVTQSDMLDALPAFELNFLNTLIIDEQADELAARNTANPDVTVDPQDLAYVVYTSGTTGMPKGVQVTHRNIMCLVHDTEYVNAEPGDGVAQVSNTAFDAFTFEIWTALVHGARLCVVPRETFLNTDAFYAALQSNNINILFITTALFNQFAREKEGMYKDLKYLLFGGEMVDAERVRHVLATGKPQHMLHVYGPTECTTYSTWYEIEDLADNAANVPIGGPLANTTAHVLDVHMQPTPPSVIGELFIGGDGLARGYLNNPELTAEKFIPDPHATSPGGRLYRTGDLVKRQGDGPILFHGRRDSQVKVRGFRIELGEIESALADYADVKEATVMVREDKPGVKRLVSYVVPANPPASGQSSPRISPMPELREYLHHKLPEYMVPAVFIVMDKIPLTPNGKVNQKALPVPEEVDESENYVAPRTERERKLAQIWSEVLGVKKVGVHDNFFELGGDSILSIQVLARANREGLTLTPRQLFQYQTVAELAEQAGTEKAIEAEQGPVSGPTHLTPIQARLFDPPRKHPEHFNNALLLQMTQRVRPETTEKALQALVDHHDGLRQRFVVEADGKCSAHIVAPDEGESLGFEVRNISGEADHAAAIERISSETHQNFNLVTGPLLRAVLFDLGTNHAQRLLILAHHLIIDGISWRALMEDFETAHNQIEAGQPPKFMPKTTSWKAWSERLAEFAVSPKMIKQSEYWLHEVAQETALIPLDHPEGMNSGEAVDGVTLALTKEETDSLLRDVPSVYNTRINDVLMTALVMAVAEETGKPQIRIALETHGREELFDDVDLSRTVGWFTAMYPVVLAFDPNAGPGNALKTIKEKLRAIPNGGIGYGILRYMNPDLRDKLRITASQLNFNYLGQVDGTSQQSKLFGFAAEPTGQEQSPRDERGFQVEIVGIIAGGCLSTSWNYCTNQFERDTIERMAERFNKALRELIAHCLTPEAGGYTPSDYPLARLSQESLDRLTARYPKHQDIYVATPMQAGMVFHTSSAPDTRVYAQQLSFRMKGDINPEIYRKAWQSVSERHPALRTRFVQTNELLHQVVMGPEEFMWTDIDLREVEESEKDALVNRHLTADLDKGYKLEDEPLVRFTLVQRGDNDFQFCFNFHHAALDGWSVPILMEEAARFYHGISFGIEPELPPMRAYRDYIGWYLRQDGDEAAAYWRTLLEDYEECKSLPVDPNADGDPHQVLNYITSYSKEDSERLDQFARHHGLTVNTLVQGAWALLLSRYTLNDDVIFGTTVSGRPPELEDVERMTGCFINTQPVRINAGDTSAVLEWLKAVQQQASDSRQYDFSPLTEIQRMSGVPRDQPLFDSLVVFENYPISESMGESWSAIVVENIELIEETNYPITLGVVFRGELNMKISYNPGMYSEAYIARMEQHLRRILVSIPDNAETRPALLPMLSEAEIKQLAEWNDTKRDYPSDRCIHGVFEDMVEKRGDQPALLHGSDEMSYAELNARANRIAAYLVDHGIEEGTPIGIAIEGEPDMLAATLGIMKAGCAYVPIDPHLPAERADFMIRDSGVKLVLTHKKQYRQESTPDGVSLIYLDSAWEAEFAGRSDANPNKPENSGRLAYIMYTSGTTGQPKGIAIHHRGVMRLVTNSRVPRFGPDDVVVQVHSISFDATTVEVWGTLLHGGRLVLMTPGAVDTLPELFEKHGVTTQFLPTQLFNVIVDDKPECFSRMRQLVPGGDLQSAAHLDRFTAQNRDTKILNGYGPTENTTLTTTHNLREYKDGVVPIGRPLDNTTVYVMDGHLNPQPYGITGELCTGGDGLAWGYINRPDLTALRFVPNPLAGGKDPGGRLYRTGDLASFQADGVLLFHGRADQQVKIRGFRVELEGIAHYLKQMPHVKDAVVLAVPRQEGDKQLAAFLVAETEDNAILEDMNPLTLIRQFLSTRLPDYMVPTAVYVLENLPLKPTGKVDRQALRAYAVKEGPLAREYVAPSTETEELAAKIWCALLGLDRVGAEDHFFELGGHSLLATRFVTHLHSEIGVNIPIKAVFEHPQLKEIAKFIEVLRWAKPPVDEELTEGEEEGEI